MSGHGGDGDGRRGPLRAGELLARCWVLAGAAVRYWLFVYPLTCAELRHWRASAARIGEPEMRRLALAALDKRSNMEGAAALASFMRLRHRRDAVRALVAFQAIYNHADMLAEQPSSDPQETARRLHAALLLALEPDGASARRDVRGLKAADTEHVAELIEACRWALSRLPGYAVAATSAVAAAERIVAFQGLILGSPGELAAWAERNETPSSGLAWWETAAAAGSSLPVHALIVASASPSLSAQQVVELDAAYFPVIGALHSLLDSLVDEGEDAETGQLNLVGCYQSTADAAASMARLGERSAQAARALPAGRAHAWLVTAMACSYLSDCEPSGGQEGAVASAVRASLGAASGPLLLIFRLRRRLGRLAPGPHAGRPEATSAPLARVESGERGAGARAA